MFEELFGENIIVRVGQNFIVLRDGDVVVFNIFTVISLSILQFFYFSFRIKVWEGVFDWQV